MVVGGLIYLLHIAHPSSISLFSVVYRLRAVLQQLPALKIAEIWWHAIATASYYLTEIVSCLYSIPSFQQGEDGKKFKTRSGETVPLVGLLDEVRDEMMLLV